MEKRIGLGRVVPCWLHVARLAGRAERIAVVWRVTRLVALAVVAGCSVQATPLAADRRLPMYGQEQGRVRSPAMAAADATYIVEAVRLDGSRPAAAAHAIRLGWVYFHQGDLVTAMSRFNQAWLLNPGGGAAFHGFAMVRAAQGADGAEVTDLFERALARGDAEAAAVDDIARYRARRK